MDSVSQLLISRVTGQVLPAPKTRQVLVDSRHIHTLWLIFVRRLLHPSGTLARVFLIADSSILDGDRLPYWGQPGALSTADCVQFGGGPPASVVDERCATRLITIQCHALPYSLWNFSRWASICLPDDY